MSFRAKLTVWYSLCLGVLFTVFGYSAHLAMLRSSIDTVDRSLTSRMSDVRDFIQRQAGRGERSLVHELQEQASLGLGGGLLELWDQDGKLLYRSPRAVRGELGPDIASLKNIAISGPTDLATGRGSNRIVSGIESFGRRSYVVRVGQPMEEFVEAQKTFDRLLYYLAPLLLAVSIVAGLAFSKRALGPVQKIGRDAHKISAGNLSQRLAVPPGKDELHELAITLNEMLGRIDGEVQRMMQFTEDASHELRTPLTLIRSAAEFALRGKRTEQELIDALGRVLRESGRTIRLISDLLTLARAGELRFETVDLAALIRSAAGQLADAAQAKRIDLTLDLPGEDVYVRADESSLGRLLLILLDNALKYTEAGGRVSIILTRQAERACIIVADTGIGIAEKDLPYIWDRFWRADKVRSRNAGGTGLGLAIAQVTANQHGAELSVESIPGQGSRFQLRIQTADGPRADQYEISDLTARPDPLPLQEQ
jgi:signal transduction histidine kinase